jgi:hypothetical protein
MILAQIRRSKNSIHVAKKITGAVKNSEKGKPE